MVFKHNYKLFTKLLTNISTNAVKVRHKSHLNSYKLRQFLTENKLKIPPILMKSYESVEQELNELKTIKDKELQDLARDEWNAMRRQLAQTEDRIVEECVVDECDDVNQCCLDLNCGVGGQEAMLFTKELFHVYLSLCRHQNWNYDLVANDCDTDFGGSRHSSLLISGTDCYRWLRHEAGVHRVQRVSILLLELN